MLANKAHVIPTIRAPSSANTRTITVFAGRCGNVCCTVFDMSTKVATRSRTYPPVPPRRGDKTPPHAPLRAIRQAAGLTLEQVGQRITEQFPEITASRGTLSAIESGSRGASDLMLRALERAYGIDAGSLTTDYVPREREQVPA